MKPLQNISLQADSMVEAHRQLGTHLSSAIRRVVRQRFKKTPDKTFAQQIRIARRCRSHLQKLGIDPRVSMTLRHGIEEYMQALSAWGSAAELASVLKKSPAVDDAYVTSDDWALWLQDDNVGCQTGLVRRAGGSVLFWHTEEDTIGYFDRPRLIQFHVDQQEWYSFLYPYLLPGPAFGWHAGKFHAIDSLDVRRRPEDQGTFTCVAAWLTWRLSGKVDAIEVLESLRPFIDGCALNVVENHDEQVMATVYEFGRDRIVKRSLGSRRGSFSLQANMVANPRCTLAKVEGLTLAERQKYCNRVTRANESIRQLAVDHQEITPEHIIKLLSSRRGGNYANSNVDVKAHCIGIISRSSSELYVAAGPATATDCYRPQFRL